MDSSKRRMTSWQRRIVLRVRRTRQRSLRLGHGRILHLGLGGPIAEQGEWSRQGQNLVGASMSNVRAVVGDRCRQQGVDIARIRLLGQAVDGIG